MTEFKLTYATMFNPPEELHTRFDTALAKVKADLGREYAMIINDKDVFADEKFEDHSPVNTDWVLAVMQKGNARTRPAGAGCCPQGLPGLEPHPLAGARQPAAQSG